jgi:hypothetical protein
MNNAQNSFDPAASAAMRRLALALRDISATITGLAVEMAQWQESHDAPDDVEPLSDVLANLLQSSFDYLIQRHGPKKVKSAAQIVEHAHDLICSEIFVVSDELLEELRDENQSEP